MITHEPLQLPFKIKEFNEDMVVALDRNFAAIEQALSRVQIYHNMPEFQKILEGSESAKSYLHEYGDVKIFRQQNAPVIGMGPDEAAENDFWIAFEEGNPIWRQVKQGQWEHVNLRPQQGDPVEMMSVVGIDAGIITAGYIRADRIEAGTITGEKINSATTIIAGEGNEIGALDGTGNYRIYAGHAQASVAPFSVYKDGSIYSSSGLIGGWVIDGETGLKLGAGSDTRGISTGDFAFYAGNASPSHAPFSVTKTGYLRAEHGVLRGLTLAESGSSGLYLSNSRLGYYDGGTWRTFMDNNGSFYLGGTNGSLTWNGSTLHIEGNGSFTGHITANSGHIGGVGGWIIQSGRIYSQDLELKVGVGTNGYIRNTSNRWILYNDGSGILANGNLSWSSGGTLTLSGGLLGGVNRVTIDSSGLNVGSSGSIRGGASSVSVGNGFWMGYAGGTYQFRIGTSSGANCIHWDGNILHIRGYLNADDIVAGTIVADEVDSNWVYAGNIHADQITAGSIHADRIATNSINVTKLDGTVISGGNIRAELLTASNIQTGVLNGNLVHVANVHAGDITTGTLSANRIGAATIDATKINVGDLTAITGNFSWLRAGSGGSYMDIDSSGLAGVSGGTEYLYVHRMGIDFRGGTSVWGTSNNFLIENSHNITLGAGSASFAVSSAGWCQVSGDLTVSGSLSKGSGDFKITHPLKEDYDLRHGFIEGPRYDLVYRGKTKLVKGKAKVNVDQASNMSEGTFAALTQNAEVVNLENRTSFARLKASELIEGEFIIECEEHNDDIVVWLVLAERKDEHILNLDHTDKYGRLIPEIKKDNTIEYFLQEFNEEKLKHKRRVENDRPERSNKRTPLN